MTSTYDQPMLPIADLVVPEYQPEQTIAERFTAFHQANPWIASALEALAADWLSYGHQKIGVKAMFEVLRWQYGRRIDRTGEPWKLNNDFSSRYARLLLERHPDWPIETRELRAA